MKRLITLVALAVFLLPALAHAQGVTTGTITAPSSTRRNNPLHGASVDRHSRAFGHHLRSDTRADGRFAIPGMRVGGPYSVTVAHGGAGTAFAPQIQENVTVNLGVATDLQFVVNPIRCAEEITVTGEVGSDLQLPAYGRSNGAQQRNARDAADDLRTARIDMVRLTPQSGGNMSFAGQDNRLNNITVDGSVFNNSFGLRSAPGETSGVAPISLAAIEQIQVNVAPFDVRQGNFVGANVNTVTRSGTKPVPRFDLPPVPRQQPRRHRSQGPDGQSRHVRFPQHRRLGGGPDRKEQGVLFRQLRERGVHAARARRSAPTWAAKPAAGNVTRVLAVRAGSR